MIFETPSIDEPEAKVLSEIDELRARLRFQVAEPRRWTALLRRVSMARAVQASNTIEGYMVSLDDALAAEADEEPLDAGEETWAAVQGYRAAMDYVLQLGRDSHFRFEASLITSLHFLLLRHEYAKGPGLYRPGSVFVTNAATGRNVYEGPDAGIVPGLVGELVGALSQPNDVPAIVRAAMAHLNLAMIHPFRDGNGRLARILQSLVLTREGILAPEFASIEEHLGRNTPAYYAVLAEVGAGSWHPERDARPWIRFCLTAHLRQATTLLRRVEEAEQLWLSVERLVHAERLPQRTVAGLVFAGYGRRLRNGMYRSLVEEDITEATATRDLARLVETGLLRPLGEKRGRWYLPAERLLGVREVLRRETPPSADPFETSPLS